MADESWLADLRGVKKVRKDGVELATRAVIDFIGAAFTVDDDPITGATRISVSPTASAIVEVKAACKCATTANDTLSGLTARDGVALVAGDRVFVSFQSTASQNGIYIASSTAWSRATDFDASSEVAPMTLITVDQGTLYADSLWAITSNAPVVLGVSALTVKRLDSSIASQIRNAVVSTATPAANDVLLYSSGTACAPGKVADANIAANASIQLSKLAPGTNGQIAKVVGGQWSAANLTVADFGESPITATPGAAQNDWSPAGWSSATIVVTSPSVTTTVTGFAAVTSGAVRKTIKNNGTAPLVIVLASASSAAANRVEAVNSATHAVVLPGCSLTVYYDTGAALWRIASVEGAVARDGHGGLRLCGSTSEPVYYDASGSVVTRRPRRLQVPLSSFMRPTTGTWYMTSAAALENTTGGGSPVASIVLPTGARITGYEAVLRFAGTASIGSAATLYLAWLDVSRAAPVVTSNAGSATAAFGTASNTSVMGTVSVSQECTNNRRFSLTLTPPSLISGSVTTTLEYVDILFDDPGPRNY